MPHARTAGTATGIALLVPITLSTMAIILLAPILPLLLREFRAVPNAEYLVPMVLTVPALCVALFSPIAGILGDRLGRRRLLMASLVLYALLGMAPAVLTDLTAILVSRVAVGITEAAIMVLTTTMIGDYFDGPARGRWLAAQTAVASVSALLFFNLGGWLGTFGWQAPFLVYGSALLMLAGVVLFTWEPTAQQRETAPDGVGAVRIPWRHFGPILGITIFASVLFYTVQIHTSVGLTELGVTDPARIGFLTSLAAVGVLAGTYLFHRAQGVPVARLLLIEFALFAAGFVTMGLAATPTVFLLGCTVVMFAAGMILPTLLVWAMSGLPFEIRGRGTGLWQGAFALGQFLSPLGVTLIGKTSGGGVLAAFAWIGAASGVAAVVTLVIGLSRRGASAAVPIAATAER